MSLNPDELLKDPLFQLNAVLWLAQPLPIDYEIKPILHQQGFSVYKIDPLLGIPPDLILKAQEAGLSIQERARPDVVLVSEKEGSFAFIECKANSFSPTSSTALQAKCLLVMAGPRAHEILGLTVSQVSGSILVYLLPENQRRLITSTLSELSDEMRRINLPASASNIFGLLIADNNISIRLDRSASKFFKMSEGVNHIIAIEPDTDPRPLYFIPYDPDLDQSVDEKKFSKRILFERIQSAVVSAVGRANPPAELNLRSKLLLNDALFGMYDRWDNQAALRHLRSLCRQLLNPISQALNSESANSMGYQSGEGWRITLKDQQHQDQMIDILTHFSCVSFDYQPDPPPELPFEEN